jgi:predicted SAM-dependent methyltransferase
MCFGYFKTVLNTLKTIKANQETAQLNYDGLTNRLDAIDSKITNIFNQTETNATNALLTKTYFDNRINNVQSDFSNTIQDPINKVADRIEFVREEILFELRVKTGTFSDKGNPQEIVAKVIDSSKMDNGIKRVNIGCGHIQPEGYINVDAREIPGVDIISSASDLIFEDGSLDEIYCSHLIEHFTELELKRKILPHWQLKLAPQGILRITVPDAKSMMSAYMKGEMSFDDLRKVTYGAQDYEGDFHYTMFTVESLSALLTEAGFKSIELVADNRVNGLCREMELIAHKL